MFSKKISSIRCARLFSILCSPVTTTNNSIRHLVRRPIPRHRGSTFFHQNIQKSTLAYAPAHAILSTPIINHRKNLKKIQELISYKINKHWQCKAAPFDSCRCLKHHPRFWYLNRAYRRFLARRSIDTNVVCAFYLEPGLKLSTNESSSNGNVMRHDSPGFNVGVLSKATKSCLGSGAKVGGASPRYCAIAKNDRCAWNAAFIRNRYSCCGLIAGYEGRCK